ncbi:plastid ribosomal S6 [Micractinium conductrix]|uniref:Plastid ribosomal S6 n=1 Tax=Micractinium conductrix TaxID=554055 RepID=A0A2P6V7A0_9CHLO|nr:plastid ribosomal S6 [Micractinium conductrix]|eukprot:PSC69962.1 plastid ribosomal S6 [Micractinium conductrix]
MAAVDTSAAPGATPPLAAPAVAPLVGELEATAASYLEPEAFFVSWQGVLTLAFRGFTAPLVDLKQRIYAAHPSLPAENPGSKWPKSSLGCLREGQRLTPEQLAALTAVCHEESAAFAALRTAAAAAAQQQQHRHHHHHHQAPGGGAAAGSEAEAGATAGVRLAVDCAAVVLFECRSLERSISYHHVAFKGGLDGAPPAAEDLARVAAIVAEQDAPGYWFAASRDGNRERHYRAPHLGATLMHPLLPQCWGGGAGGAAAADLSRAGWRAGGQQQRADRQALLAAIAHFRARVDAALPGIAFAAALVEQQQTMSAVAQLSLAPACAAQRQCASQRSGSVLAAPRLAAARAFAPASSSKAAARSSSLLVKAAAAEAAAATEQRTYETMLVLRPTMADEERDQELAKFQAFLQKEGATGLSDLVRGRQRLAYPIKRFTEGIYVLYSYKAAPSAGQAVQKFLSTPTASGVSNILRHMTFAQ